MWLCRTHLQEGDEREREREREFGREIEEAVCQGGRERHSRLWVGGLKKSQMFDGRLFPLKQTGLASSGMYQSFPLIVKSILEAARPCSVEIYSHWLPEKKKKGGTHIHYLYCLKLRYLMKHSEQQTSVRNDRDHNEVGGLLHSGVSVIMAH